jgi:CTP synthase (UTP-ammonia lyase)
MPKLALIGDYNAEIVAHRAIPLALESAAKTIGCALTWDWIGTDALSEAPHQLAACDGLWCVPGSPYRSMDGALAAIRFARETKRPFLGTCGGFQHALIEFARNAANLPGADHAETARPTRHATHDIPNAAELVITPLACSLVGQHEDILFTSGSQLHRIFAGRPSREGYHCNYGINPLYRSRLEAAGLRFSGFDREMQIRALELPVHPFFIGTLFQPERSALAGRPHPLIQALIRAIAARGVAVTSATARALP